MEVTPTETQSPSGVGVVRLTTVSIAAFAADAAELAPRASMIAAPRFCTVVMKSPRNQSWSVIAAGAATPFRVALAKSGNWVAEWLPQIARFLTCDTGTPAFLASCVSARFWSRRVIANQRSAGTSGALERAIKQLVLHGLPTTRTRTSLAALAAIARPWGLKIPPLTLSKSPRSMPALRGMEPTSRAHDVLVKARSRSLVASMSLSRGKAQSSSSMTTP